MSETRSPAMDSAQAQMGSAHRWNKIPLIAGLVGVAGIGTSYALSGSYAHAQFYFSYLTAFVFWLSIALGALFFVIVNYASKAGWSVVVRRLAENAMVTLPLFAVLFLPIAIAGMHDLFHWSHAEAVAKDPILQHKLAYLNLPAFYLRALLYFVVWAALGIYYFRNSVAQDATGNPEITGRLQAVSGPAIVFFALTSTFAAVDWIMSLDAHWYSTMYGVYFFSGCVVAIFAFLSAVGIVMRRAGLLDRVITREHYHDLGKLLFGFMVFWTYIAFSQFMLIWYGNIPEETLWFAHRSRGAWKSLSVLLAVGHFGAPFLYLMTRATKRSIAALFCASVWLLVMHYADLYWLIMPTLHTEGIQMTLLDATTLLGIGGLFIALFSLQLRRHALVPIRDPRLAESISFENY